MRIFTLASGSGSGGRRVQVVRQKADEQQQQGCVTIRIVDVLDELGTAVMKKKRWQSKEGGKESELFIYYLFIIFALPFRDRPRRQTRIVVEGRILRLCECLLHQLRVGPAEDRVDDARIEDRPPREGHGAGRRVDDGICSA